MVTPRPPGTLITVLINNLKSCLFTNVPFVGFQYAVYSFFPHENHVALLSVHVNMLEPLIRLISVVEN